MKAKKYLIAMAIFGGALFSATYIATNLESNEQTTEIASVPKNIKKPPHG